MALFATELNKLKIEASTKNLKPVTKDRIKKSIEVLLDKYKQKMTADTAEKTPVSSQHLAQMKKEADELRDFLEGRRSSK